MNKKLAITYTFLFLFAFTFALSFTLASQAQAQPDPTCCVISWCNPPYNTEVGQEGHWVKVLGVFVCIQRDNHECDWTYLC